MAVPSDRSMEKRRRMLDAARFLILRDGLRGTTMEAIAREAGVAKATLYAQFPDKTAVFAGIVDTVLGEIGAAFDAGMAQAGPIEERIGAALAGQYLALANALQGSPHAGELMSEHKRSAMALETIEQDFGGAIGAALAAEGVKDASELAHLLAAAAYGIALKTRDNDAMQEGIRRLCRRLITPELRP